MGEREHGRARGARELLLARPFFLVPTTSKRLLRRLGTTLLAPVVVFSGDHSDKLTAPGTNTLSVCLRAFSFDLLVTVECG